MYYVYVLISLVDYNFYVGFTSDLKARIKAHKEGRVFSTKGRLPVKIIFYEAYLSRDDALRREHYLKSGKGRTTLRTMLSECLSAIEKQK